MAILGHELERVLHPDAAALAHGHDVILAEHLAIHLPEILVQAGTLGVVGHVVAMVGSRQRREGGVLGDEGDDVHAEAVHAFVEPEPHDVIDLPPNARIFPLEVGLFAAEVMQVVCARRRIVAPGAPLFVEEAPALGRRASLRRPPVVVVAVGIGPAAAALPEPRVLVAGGVDHQVHDQRDAALVQPLEHRVEIGHRPHLGHDGAVVADVVAVVVVGGLVDRVEPHDVHAQALDVVEPGGDAPEVADAVAVAVLEAARVDLIDHDFLPPGPARGGGFDGFGDRSRCRRGRGRTRREQEHQEQLETGLHRTDRTSGRRRRSDQA
jgi:hypothetical protein